MTAAPAAAPAEILAGDIAVLQEAYGAAGDPAALDLLLAEAQRLQSAEPDHAGICLITANILRKRQGYQAATSHLLAFARRQPDADVLYEAALFSIDAGNHADAQAVLARIGRGQLACLTDRQLRGIWRAAPLVGMHGLASRAFETGRARGSAYGTDAVRERIATAAANTKRRSWAGIGLISLGENCLPWHMLNRWGLRGHARLLTHDSPWSLAQTCTDGVSRLLEDGIAALYDSAALELVTQPDGRLAPYNGRYAFSFLHELGTDFAADGFARLKARYAEKQARLERWFNEAPCVFIHYTESEGDMNRLAAALRRRLRHDRFRLLIIDAWGGARKEPPDAAAATCVKVTLPAPGYIWYMPDNYDSDAGVTFERRLQNAVIGTLRELAA